MKKVYSWSKVVNEFSLEGPSIMLDPIHATEVSAGSNISEAD